MVVAFYFRLHLAYFPRPVVAIFARPEHYFDTIYADTLLPHRAIPVYMYLKDRSGSTGSCWPGIKTIAKDLNLSRSTVKRALTDLEQRGYLAKLPRYRPNGSNTSNLYTLL